MTMCGFLFFINVALEIFFQRIFFIFLKFFPLWVPLAFDEDLFWCFNDDVWVNLLKLLILLTVANDLRKKCIVESL